ncbi:MAG TPA: GNAT family N-acetyltransferase [Myxococcales bacterium]|nr:GNAT family N-acetyltransferase [Myxococcales bacterium]
MSGLELQVHRHIDEIDPQEWDSVVEPDDLQASHRFVKVCQDSGVEDAEYRHLVARQGGRVVGVASLSLMHVSVDILTRGLTRRAIRWIRRRAPSFLRMPVIFCGLPVSFGGSCLRSAPGVAREPLVAAVAEALEGFARERSVGLLCFKELSDAHAAGLHALRGAGYFAAPSIPFCSMPIRWSSFGAYLSQMRTGYRRQLRASLGVRERSGLAVRKVEDFAPWCPAIFALYEQVMERAPYQLERLNLAFLQRLNEAFGAQAQALLVEREGKLLSAAILLSSPRVLTFLIAGIDYALNREHGAYLNLVCEVVAEAIRAGSASLDLGQTSYQLKGRMGAVTEPRHLFIRHRSAFWHSAMRATSGLLFPRLAVPPRRVFKAP